MKNLRLHAFIAIIALAIGFWAGRSDYSTKSITRDKSKETEDTRIVEKIVEKPDGEKITYRTVKKKDVKKRNNVTEYHDKSKDWLVGLSHSVYKPFGAPPSQTLTLDRRVLGDAFMGVYGRTDGEVGISLKYQF